MLTYRTFVSALREVGLSRESRVLVHASMARFPPVAGGEEAVLGALLATCGTLVMPAFTRRTMVIPAVGPPGNGLTYGADNRLAEAFDPGMPADADMGALVELLRRHPAARRSSHPVFSFVGVNAEEFLEAQSLADPLGPIARLAEADGDVLLLGADHTVNLALHYAEHVAERKRFTRWALTDEGVVTCPNSPGCAHGFPAIEPRLQGLVRETQVGEGSIQSYPIRDIVHTAVAWMHEDPQALLCDRPDCERCRDIRAWLDASPSGTS
jgi:aminoglycoside 3-N-acetyltransferase